MMTTTMTQRKNNFFNGLNSVPTYLKIGQFTHTHGLKGDLFVSSYFVNQEICNLLFGKEVRLEKAKEIPEGRLSIHPANTFSVKIQKACLHKKGMIVHLQNLDSIEKVIPFKGYDFYVPRDVFSSHSGEPIYLIEVLNFQVYDREKKQLGEVVSFSHNGSQDLLNVSAGNKKQIEIPFIEEYLFDIDFESKRIVVDLPSGWPSWSETT